MSEKLGYLLIIVRDFSLVIALDTQFQVVKGLLLNGTVGGLGLMVYCYLGTEGYYYLLEDVYVELAEWVIINLVF